VPHNPVKLVHRFSGDKVRFIFYVCFMFVLIINYFTSMIIVCNIGKASTICLPIFLFAFVYSTKIDCLYVCLCIFNTICAYKLIYAFKMLSLTCKT
jgi:hypothetical protein